MRTVLLALLLMILAAPNASAVEISGSELFIPVVARGPGAFGTQWQTDVVVSSRHEHFITDVILFYKPSGQVPIQLTLTLPPRATITLTDIIGERIGLESSTGTLTLFAVDTRVRISAHARIYNTGNSAGEFGQSVPAIDRGKLDTTAWLHGLNGLRNQRTNVAIANPNDVPALYSITWIDKNGETRGSAMLFELAHHSVTFYNDIFAWVGVEPDEGLTLRFRANVPIYAVASVIRNDTGDAYTIVGDGGED